MSHTVAPRWESKRTAETRMVEDVVKKAGFESVDAYRYNAAAIRLRVIDPQFEGLSMEERDARVEPHIEKLPEQTQSDLISLFTFAPSELQQSDANYREYLMNMEFEDPSPSML